MNENLKTIAEEIHKHHIYYTEWVAEELGEGIQGATKRILENTNLDEDENYWEYQEAINETLFTMFIQSLSEEAIKHARENKLNSEEKIQEAITREIE